MPEDRASRDGLLYLKDEELRSVIRNVPISDVYCVEDTVFARGKFATVRRALHKTTGVQYAAKYIKKRRRNVNMVPEIKHEISVLLKCSSNNRVVRLYEVYETNSDMVLILGLAAGGELQRIFDGDQCLGEIEARRAMRQILEGLCYLHERNIAHLDLKPQNILLMVEDSCDDIKLCDFGISRLLEPGTEVRTLSGTPDYVAPEVVSYEPISLATDIWSVGVLAYVLLSGYTPFGADTKEQTSLNISKGIVTFEPEDFVDVSTVALDFMRSILVLNPKQRPTVQDLLQHPWITPQSHILPSLPLKPNTDAINITPKSTPINQRKSLPCPPEVPPSNTRTPFNSENLNDNIKDEHQQEEQFHGTENNNLPENGIQQFEEITLPENEDEDIAAAQNFTEQKHFFTDMLHNQDGDAEVVTPSEVLSEVSSEEIEENFCLLKSIEKSESIEEFPVNEAENKHELGKSNEELDQLNKMTNNFDIFLESRDNGSLSRSCEDINSDSGIVGSEEEYSNKNDVQLEHHEQVSEITINFGMELNDGEDVKNGISNDIINTEHSTGGKLFVNTYEVDKQIVFTLNCGTMSQAKEEVTKEKILMTPFEIRDVFEREDCTVTKSHIEILSSNNDSHENEEKEYCHESNEIFVNTYEIKND